MPPPSPIDNTAQVFYSQRRARRGLTHKVTPAISFAGTLSRNSLKETTSWRPNTAQGGKVGMRVKQAPCKLIPNSARGPWIPAFTGMPSLIKALRRACPREDEGGNLRPRLVHQTKPRGVSQCDLAGQIGPHVTL